VYHECIYRIYLNVKQLSILDIKQLKQNIFDLYASAELNVNVAELDALNKLLSTPETTAQPVNSRSEIMVLNKSKIPLMLADKENTCNTMIPKYVATNMLSDPVGCMVVQSVMMPGTSATTIRMTTPSSRMSIATPRPPERITFSKTMLPQSPVASSSVASSVSLSRVKCSPKDFIELCNSPSPRGKSTGTLVQLLPLSAMCSSSATSDGYCSPNVKVENIKLEPSSPRGKKRPKYDVGA